MPKSVRTSCGMPTLENSCRVGSLSYGTSRVFAQGEGLRVTSGIITNYQDVLVACLSSLQGAYNVHRYAGKRYLNDRKWLKGIRASLPVASQLASRKGLTIAQHITIEPWLKKPGCDSFMALGVA